MPTSPSGICKSCNSRATTNGYCEKHQNDRLEQKRDYDRWRSDDPVRLLYRCKRWKSVRRAVLQRDILCRSCGHQMATEVDHILSARLVIDNYGKDAFYDPERLQGLCHPCHSAKTAIECGWAGRKGTKLVDFGNRSNLTIVCGQAGSGKTTYVASRKRASDLVWDYDVIMAELTGLPMHQGLPGAIGSVLANRDQWIEATRYSSNHCWLIVSNPKAVIVDALREAGARVIVMDTPVDECKRRVKARFIVETMQQATSK